MNNVQDWMDQLGPTVMLSSISIIFLVASIGGWYLGRLIQRLQR